ncbi:Low-density lipoprotein receptor domain class A [Necator americanus]|uniref:Low-density lipoprotein receptor domain class A n=1 Tax=Necator americanus TaxID=51031 RepID=W2SJI3_NECAM|nr:Low-density lipoprotein receptor domain class A [Necator americanus]ETN69723.1 Low-density lipoprotein receptor domain class A [Necator americanus]
MGVYPCRCMEEQLVLPETGKRSISHCGGDEFKCGNGECIPKAEQCDRKYDCSDGSDETKCGQCGILVSYVLWVQKARLRSDEIKDKMMNKIIECMDSTSCSQ